MCPGPLSTLSKFDLKLPMSKLIIFLSPSAFQIKNLGDVYYLLFKVGVRVYLLNYEPGGEYVIDQGDLMVPDHDWITDDLIVISDSGNGRLPTENSCPRGTIILHVIFWIRRFLLSKIWYIFVYFISTGEFIPRYNACRRLCKTCGHW